MDPFSQFKVSIMNFFLNNYNLFYLLLNLLFYNNLYSLTARLP